jgi:uncharacterized protein
MRTILLPDFISFDCILTAWLNRGENTVQAKSNDGRMDYIEFPATDIVKTKSFYEKVFDWKFTDYGPDYTSFEDGRLAGGFSKERHAIQGGPLIVIYAQDLPAMEQAVRSAGAKISKEIFSFPGGRRFHFIDPNGNELAVWSEL